MVILTEKDLDKICEKVYHMNNLIKLQVDMVTLEEYHEQMVELFYLTKVFKKRKKR